MMNLMKNLLLLNTDKYKKAKLNINVLLTLKSQWPYSDGD